MVTKKQRQGIAIAIFLAVAVILFANFQTLTILPPPEGFHTRTINWQGNSVFLEATRFGQETLSPDIPGCREGVTILNEFTSNTKLSLHSRTDAPDMCSGNGIRATMVVQGKLRFNYDVSSQENQEGSATAVVNVKKNLNDLDNLANKFSEFKIGGQNNIPSDSGTFELNFNTPTQIIVTLRNHVFSSGFSDAKVEIEFVVDKINVYRFSNNQCNLIQIIPSQRTSFDFDSLTACELNIITDGNGNGNGEEPPTPIGINPIFIIIGLLIFVGILILIFLRLRK